MAKISNTQIIGESKPVKDLLSMIKRVSVTKTNILVIGESGTGKELVARMIHDSGPLAPKPFIPVNCGAIPETLIESELFGYKKGSFTGAYAEKMGLFEAANGGTLFLDEVGELPLNMQVKLLRAIQERAFRKVGGTDDIKVDVRIIAATNRDLEAGVAKGTFREDLYYRLNVILLRTPNLRERKGDIPILAEFFLKRFAKKLGRELKGFSEEAMAVLVSYTWPGNIRELENVVERAVTLGNGDIIESATLPIAIGKSIKAEADSLKISTAATRALEIRLPAPDFSKGAVNLDSILDEVEAQYVRSALDFTAGVKKTAAEVLGITFRSFRYRLKKLGLESGDEGAGDESDAP